MTEAQKRATAKYFASMGRIDIRPTKELEAAIKAHAQERGESVQGFVIRAIKEQLERDK